MLVLTVKEDGFSIILANRGIRNQQEAAENQPELTCVITRRKRLPDPAQPNSHQLPHNQPSLEVLQSRSGDCARDVCREQISMETRPRQSPAQAMLLLDW